MQVERLEEYRSIDLICNGHADCCELLHAEINHYFNAGFASSADDGYGFPSVNIAHVPKCTTIPFQKIMADII